MVKTQYNVKIEKRDLDLMRKVTQVRGDDTSDFIRISIRKELARLGCLNEKEAKILGVNFT